MELCGIWQTLLVNEQSPVVFPSVYSTPLSCCPLCLPLPHWPLPCSNIQTSYFAINHRLFIRDYYFMRMQPWWQICSTYRYCLVFSNATLKPVSSLYFSVKMFQNNVSCYSRVHGVLLHCGHAVLWLMYLLIAWHWFVCKYNVFKCLSMQFHGVLTVLSPSLS